MKKVKLKLVENTLTSNSENPTYRQGISKINLKDKIILDLKLKII